MRLTLLYGVLFVASGAVLLIITYLLVNRPPHDMFLLIRRGSGPSPGGGARVCPGAGCSSAIDGFAEERRRQAIRQHAAEMHHLLVESGIALAIMSVIAIGLGWLVAGRVLRPLRTMTSTIQRISAHNVHERLAIEGADDELKHLADTVDGLLGRVEAALESHKRFVANAAHELRTPLTVEHALLEESLIDRDATVESFRSNFERLLVLSRQQARLLESLLTLSSSERGLDRREPLRLAELAGHVVLGCRQEAELRGLRVEFKDAEQACRDKSPQGQGGGPGGTLDSAKVAAWAKCLRENGLPKFPDPEINGSSMNIDIAGSGIKPGGPEFTKAMKTCQSKYPGGAMKMGSAPGGGTR